MTNDTESGMGAPLASPYHTVLPYQLGPDQPPL